MSPLLHVTVHPKSRADEAALQSAMQSLAAQDSALSAGTDTATDQTIISGASEPHLDFTIEELRRLYKVDFTTGPVQVAYREIIGDTVETKYGHKRVQSQQYAEVRMIFRPLEQGGGIIFENRASAVAVPPRFIPAIESGLRSQAENGTLAGFPTVDFKCTLIDGRYHDMDSSPLAFEIAAKACFRELGNTGLIRIVEPIMEVDVTVDLGMSQEIIDDLDKRGGRIQTSSLRHGKAIVTALVPLRGMLGYADALHSLSRGHAQFMMLYSHYQEVMRPDPPDDPLATAVALRA